MFRSSVSKISSPFVEQASILTSLIHLSDNSSVKSLKSTNFFCEEIMRPAILRDPDATTKLLEAILDAPNGKRMLSRVARTCRALCEPALNVLWRDLDSLVPILWQFPGHLLKKARKPGLGFINPPSEQDWANVFKHSARVRQITYGETASNVAASVFTILEDTCPRTHIFPHLLELNWKAETPAGLARSSMFLTPGLSAISLEVGTRLSQLDAFLANIAAHTTLTSFTFISPTSLPESFTQHFDHQHSLEKLSLMAPGALAPAVGQWIASLPELKSLRLDLTGRSTIAVEGFFDELLPRSGYSTPSSITSTDHDSGVFSDDDEVDFSLIRKSVLRLVTGDSKSNGSFIKMRRLQLIGDVANIAVFLKHITSPLTQLELVIEDPPDRADWHDLSALICEKFGDCLQSLKVSATASSRFADLVRSTSRAEPAASRLSLEQLSYLPSLKRLEIDLPESVVVTDKDLQCLAKACPSLEVLKLCPLACFPTATRGPKLTLDSIARLVSSCPKLHTLGAVIDAKNGSKDILSSPLASSKSLLRLHVGHSWNDNPLQVAIFLSHIAPHLDTLKWFQEKTRSGFVEANARGWQGTSDLLPHLQGIRLLERKFASDVTPRVASKITVDQSVDATTRMAECGIQATPLTQCIAVQVSTTAVAKSVQATSEYISVFVDATPSTADVDIEAIPTLIDQGVDPLPSTPPNSVSKAVQALLTPSTFMQPQTPISMTFISLPSFVGLVSLVLRFLVFYPLSLPSRVLQSTAARIKWRHHHIADAQALEGQSKTAQSDIPLDSIMPAQDAN